MADDKILVLGGTGHAGICLVRELLHRRLQTVIFARSPSKLPEDLAQDPLLEIVKGEFCDKEALSTAVSKCRTVLSLLGPQLGAPEPKDLFADFYRTLFATMRQHGVRRIFALSTVSTYSPEDRFSLLRSFTTTMLRTFYSNTYDNALANTAAFEDEAATADIDWTFFRVAAIPGGSDAESWKRDREDGETYVGPVGEPGWTMSQKRSALARWLVDVAESGAPDLIRQMPAVSRRSGS